MIFQLAILFALLGLAFIVGEYLRHKLGFSNEWSRKLVHILHGIGLASLAFIVPLDVVLVFEVVFLVAVTAGRYLYENYSRTRWVRYLGEMYRVGRLSYGEFFFPISVILCVWIAESNWIFAAAVLVLGIADTVAALVGKKYGKSNSYSIFGQKKSLVGSAAFFVVTVAILGAFFVFSGVSMAMAVPLIAGIAFVLTAAENLGVYGSDNLLIPLIAALALNILT